MPWLYASLLDSLESFQRPRTSFSVVNDGQRIGAPQLNSGLSQKTSGSLPRLVNPLARQLVQLRYPVADIVTLRIDLLSLSHRVEDAEVRGGVSTATSRPLPAQGVVCQIGIHQRVPEPSRTLLPRNQQVLDQERRHDHADAIVHPARVPQLAHAGVHDGIAGAPALPGP